MSSQPRQPAGVRTGGQYTTTQRGEPAVTLTTGHLHDVLKGAYGEPGQRVLDALTDAGGHPYLVGGCVRDALLGLSPKDIDIEVYGLTQQQVHHALSDVGAISEVGASFSVTTLRVDGHDFDVALPRTEVKTGPRHTDFEVSPNPLATTLDASRRRDFTMNALLFDPATGEVIDHWGGVRDLEDRVLRHTSGAFAEDPLRVLRAARFAARFDMTVHPDTVALARSIRDEYQHLPVERVWAEWRGIGATASHPSAALQVLADTGWEAHFPQISALHGVPQDPVWHPEGDVWVHSGLAGDKAAQLADTAGLTGDERAVVVLAALLHDVGKVEHTQVVKDRITSHGHDSGGVQPAREFLTSIGAPRTLVDQVLPLVGNHMAATSLQRPVPKAAVVRRLVRRLHPATISQWALVCEADKGGRGSASRPSGSEVWVDIARELNIESSPRPRLLRGGHLIAAGLTPGPQFRELLEESLAAQDDGVFADEQGATAWLRSKLT